MILPRRVRKNSDPGWPLVLTGAVLCLLWIVPGGVSGMHDSDQAAVLGDAWKIATGGGRENGEFYNYDKLFVSHWLLAGLFWIARRVGAADVVLMGNLCSSLLASLGILMVQVGARFRWRSYAAFLATVLAPTFLLHVPFMAPAFISSSFLLLLHEALRRGRCSRNPGHFFTITLLTFAAVGARADAILALPFLLWLHLPLGWPPWRAWRMRAFPAVAAGALLAGVVALSLRDQDVVYRGDLAFNAQVFAAYVLFGLGGALPLLCWTWLRMGSLFCRPAPRPRRGWLLGILLLAPPYVFYALQLNSTRYWTVGLTALLVWIASRRGQILLEGRFAGGTIAGAVLAAVVPLGVGALVITPKRFPRWVTHHATAFPSADGLIPMGAYVGHDFGRREPATGGSRDHNHAVWLAAQNASFVPAVDGKVPALITPTYSILRLAMLLGDQQVRGFKAFEVPAICYADSRSLLKYPRPLAAQEQSGDPLAAQVADAAIEPVSPAFRRIAIQRIQAGLRPPGARPVWEVFRGIFQGDDFWPRAGDEVWKEDHTLRVALGRGATMAVLSPVRFGLMITRRAGDSRVISSAAAGSFPEWQVVILDGGATDATSVRLSAETAPEAPFFSAEATLPDYMSQTRARR